MRMRLRTANIYCYPVDESEWLYHPDFRIKLEAMGKLSSFFPNQQNTLTIFRGNP